MVRKEDVKFTKLVPKKAKVKTRDHDKGIDTRKLRERGTSTRNH